MNISGIKLKNNASVKDNQPQFTLSGNSASLRIDTTQKNIQNTTITNQTPHPREPSTTGTGASLPSSASNKQGSFLSTIPNTNTSSSLLPAPNTTTISSSSSSQPTAKWQWYAKPTKPKVKYTTFQAYETAGVPLPKAALPKEEDDNEPNDNNNNNHHHTENNTNATTRTTTIARSTTVSTAANTTSNNNNHRSDPYAAYRGGSSTTTSTTTTTPATTTTTSAAEDNNNGREGGRSEVRARVISHRTLSNGPASTTTTTTTTANFSAASTTVNPVPTPSTTNPLPNTDAVPIVIPPPLTHYSTWCNDAIPGGSMLQWEDERRNILSEGYSLLKIAALKKSKKSTTKGKKKEQKINSVRGPGSSHDTNGPVSLSSSATNEGDNEEEDEEEETKGISISTENTKNNEDDDNNELRTTKDDVLGSQDPYSMPWDVIPDDDDDHEDNEDTVKNNTDTKLSHASVTISSSSSSSSESTLPLPTIKSLSYYKSLNKQTLSSSTSTVSKLGNTSTTTVSTFHSIPSSSSASTVVSTSSLLPLPPAYDKDTFEIQPFTIESSTFHQPFNGWVLPPKLSKYQTFFQSIHIPPSCVLNQETMTLSSSSSSLYSHTQSIPKNSEDYVSSKDRLRYNYEMKILAQIHRYSQYIESISNRQIIKKTKGIQRTLPSQQQGHGWNTYANSLTYPLDTSSSSSALSSYVQNIFHLYESPYASFYRSNTNELVNKVPSLNEMDQLTGILTASLSSSSSSSSNDSTNNSTTTGSSLSSVYGTTATTNTLKSTSAAVDAVSSIVSFLQYSSLSKKSSSGDNIESSATTTDNNIVMDPLNVDKAFANAPVHLKDYMKNKLDIMNRLQLQSRQYETWISSLLGNITNPKSSLAYHPLLMNRRLHELATYVLMKELNQINNGPASIMHTERSSFENYLGYNNATEISALKDNHASSKKGAGIKKSKLVGPHRALPGTGVTNPYELGNIYTTVSSSSMISCRGLQGCHLMNKLIWDCSLTGIIYQELPRFLNQGLLTIPIQPILVRTGTNSVSGMLTTEIDKNNENTYRSKIITVSSSSSSSVTSPTITNATRFQSRLPLTSSSTVTTTTRTGAGSPVSFVSHKSPLSSISPPQVPVLMNL